MQTCDEGARTNEDQICHMSIIHRNWERWARVKGATHRQKPVKNSVRLKSGQHDRTPTEHSSFEVCTQPDRSLRTQQAECFSRSRAARMKLCTCGSWRMHGENLAPR